MRRILVAGVGNRLMGDDGFGPRVIDLLTNYSLPEYVELRDIGTAGITIATDLSDYDTVIFLDSMNLDGEPGKVVKSLVKVEEGVEDPSELAKTTLHEVGLEGLLRFSKSIGTLPPEVILIGCKPKTIAVSLDLSLEVEEATIIAAKMVKKIVEKKSMNSRARFYNEILCMTTSTARWREVFFFINVACLTVISY